MYTSESTPIRRAPSTEMQATLVSLLLLFSYTVAKMLDFAAPFKKNVKIKFFAENDSNSHEIVTMPLTVMFYW